MLYLTLYSILSDIVITLSFWGYEANPIALALGPVGFTIIKIILLPVVVIAYNSIKQWKDIAGIISLLPAFMLHFIVVIQNIVLLVQ